MSDKNNCTCNDNEFDCLNLPKDINRKLLGLLKNKGLIGLMKSQNSKMIEKYTMNISNKQYEKGYISKIIELLRC
jgi:hypothetical protein